MSARGKDAGPPVRLDVSRLPGAALGADDTFWWGNTLLMAIETTTVVLLVASYFYLRQNFESWPPPRAAHPPIYNPVPDLAAGTINLLLLLASCVLMVVLHRIGRARVRAARESEADDRPTEEAEWSRARDSSRARLVIPGLLVLGIVCLVAMGLRLFEFPAVKFSWSDNAYGSVVWAMLVLHMSYLAIGAAEFFSLAFWISRYGFDETLGLEMLLTASYWYWTVGAWILLYFVIYWAPRVV